MTAEKTWRASRFAAVAILLALPLAGCGTSDDAPATDTGPDSSQTAPEQSEAPADTSGEDLPDGFPGDIPLPQDAKLERFDALGDVGWHLYFDIGEQDAEEYMQQYAQELESAGLVDVSAAGGGISAKTSSFDVGVTIDPPELFLQVTKQQ